mmetsp:Transcript_35486/g.33663  ORF Transcript_35486/g.33663 Transcript_35486/m.33663 type:complete len:417 (+) Transcript_35486:52-1302(+)
MGSNYFVRITYILIFGFALVATQISEKIIVPVEIHDSFKNTVYIKNFEINCTEKALEVVISQFCTEFDLHKNECDMLHNHIVLSFQDECPALKEIDNNSPDYVANALPHLLRHTEAVHAELGTFLRAEKDFIVAAEVEDYQLDLLIKEVNESIIILKTVAFLHSCTLPGGDNSVLYDMLFKITQSGLMNHFDQLWVFNYGDQIGDRIQQQFSSVKFIQMYKDTSFFELPTIRIIQSMAQHFNKIYNHDVKILYLHTKGVSYKKAYQQIVDWRDMMIYFLVEKYESNFHLLESKMFDAIGSNYYTLPKRHFDGNFWWSTSRYIQCLEPLSLRLHSKYDAEYWLLGSQSARVFIHHMSSLYHGTQEYPRDYYVYKEDNYNFNQLEEQYLDSDIKGTCTSRASFHLSMCVHLPAIHAGV